jgi:hypothetical protein
MKKTQKRLALRKITIADVSPHQLAEVTGGLPKLNWTKASVCAEQSCDTDRNSNCPRTF